MMNRLVLLATLVVLLAATSLAHGSHTLSLREVGEALWGRSDLPLSSPSDTATEAELIVRGLRLPRTLTALLAGAALGIGGLVMQTIFRNPLAGPGLLGINAGAGLGVALVVLASEAVGLGALRTGGVGLTAAALGGAAITMMWIVFLARRFGTLTLLVLGLLLGQFAAALTGVLIHVSSAQQIQRFAGWGLGSFQGVEPAGIAMLGLMTAVGFVLILFHLKALNAWLLGDDGASALGISVPAARTVLAAAASLLAGAVTAWCGPIAFLGVAVPHLARGVMGRADHRWLLPACALAGAALALAADLATRWPTFPLPLNGVMALVGVPIVVTVVLKTTRFWEKS